MPNKENSGHIQAIKKLVTSIEIFLDILVSYEPFTSSELIEEFTQKLIYLQFSGIIDTIRKSLKVKTDTEFITNVRLAETLSFITDENQVIIEKLLPGLPYLMAGNPHAAFTAGMIGKTIPVLENDGFDVSKLKAVIEKMQAEMHM